VTVSTVAESLRRAIKKLMLNSGDTVER
jgi:hypothetical protein